MKRILSIGLLVLLLVISWVMPVSAHDEGHENDGDDSTLATCSVPFPTLNMDEQPELDFYEMLIYSIEMSDVEEILASDPEHELLHASEYQIEWYPVGTPITPNEFGQGGCHGNIHLYQPVCEFLKGCKLKLVRIHWRHCPADKCGGHDCP